jgi:photosystem II stability/assembly factor-like uncharacterized protein
MRSLSVIIATLLALLSGGMAQSWTPVTSGVTTTLYTVHFVNPNVGWIGGDGAVIRKTTNGGSSWTAQTGSRNITSIQFLDANTGWAVGGSGGVGTILRTTNGGTNWSIVTNSGIAVLCSFQFLDSIRGLAVGAGGAILKTVNGGVNWNAQTSGTSIDFRDHQFLDTNTGWATGYSGTILKTTNGGATWAPQNSGTTNLLGDIFFINADTGWCVGIGGIILKTVNGGATWTPQNSGTTNELLSMFFLNASTGYVGGLNGTLLKTTNGGAAWVPQNTGTTSALFSVQLLNSETGWLSGGSGTLLKTSSPFPSSLSYATNPATYTQGVSITPNTPSVAGATPFTYSIAPELPAGLTLSTTTGVISGTPATQAIPAGYVITATNIYGSTAAVVNIGIISGLYGLTYATNPAFYEVGVAIAPNLATVTGPVTGYSVSPALPSGLTLNPTTGAVTGTPAAPAATANYTVTVHNGAGGSTSVNLNITVLLKPSNLAYSSNPTTYVVGNAITPNLPSLQGSAPMTYSVNPALPAGLSLSPTSGAITGIPSAATATAFYTITVANPVGSTVAVLIITTSTTSVFSTAPSDRTFGFSPAGAPHLTFGIPRRDIEAVRVEILNMRGSRVWETTAAAGADLVWNGMTAAGNPAAAGVYSIRVTWLTGLNGRGNTAGPVSRQFAFVASP